jgi:hypothetical protein
MRKSITVAATCIFAALSIAACGSVSSSGGTGTAASQPTAPGDNTEQVVTDLESLLTDKGVTYSSVPYCTHASGNDYTCQVNGTSDGTDYPSVTDDGNSIYEQGVGQ